MDKFGKWLEAETALKVSQMLGISRNAVYNWMLGVRQPRPEVAHRIIAISDLTLDDIYNPKRYKVCKYHRKSGSIGL